MHARAFWRVACRHTSMYGASATHVSHSLFCLSPWSACCDSRTESWCRCRARWSSSSRQISKGPSVVKKGSICNTEVYGVVSFYTPIFQVNMILQTLCMANHEISFKVQWRGAPSRADPRGRRGTVNVSLYYVRTRARRRRFSQY